MGYGPVTPGGKQLPITPYKGSWAWEQEQKRMGGEPYNEQLARARCWDKAVDFGSPMSAWTPEMLKAASEKVSAPNSASHN